MAQVTFKGEPVDLVGNLPGVGRKAPDFHLTSGNLSDRKLGDYAGKRKLLNIFPSLDTPVCATSVKRFNEAAEKHGDAAFLMISADLPFAHGRFCHEQGTNNVETLSMMRDKRFAEDYGILIVDGPLAGLTARAVVVLDENEKVLHAELVPEIGEEPDYDAALAALS